MINKTYKNHYIAIFILCGILMVVGGFFDYKITDTLYNPTSAFGMAFEAFGHFPIYACIPIFGACLMVRSKNNFLPFLIGAGLLIGYCVFYVYIAATDLEKRDFITQLNTYLCGVFGGLLAALIFILIRKVKKPNLRKIQAMCAFGMAYLIFETGAILVLKKIFGRDRYEDIISKPDSYSFANWFSPEFFSSGSSFPSGHTAAAMGIIVLLLAPFLFRNLRKYKNLIFVLCYGYVFAMAFSRFIMGRHFLSDTAMSVIVMTVIFIVLTPFFENVYRQEFNNR